jgi:hypothetical protein
MSKKRLTVSSAQKYFRDVVVPQRRKFNLSDTYVLVAHVAAIRSAIHRFAQYHDCDKNSLLIASYLHDRAKTRGNHNHTKRSLKMAEDYFRNIPDIVSECVLHHDNGHETDIPEVALFQLGDKISIFDQVYASVKRVSFDPHNPQRAIRKLQEYQRRKMRQLENIVDTHSDLLHVGKLKLVFVQYGLKMRKEKKHYSIKRQ